MKNFLLWHKQMIGDTPKADIPAWAENIAIFIFIGLPLILLTWLLRML